MTTLRGPLNAGVLYVSGGRHVGGRQASFGGADFLARFLRSLGLDIDDDAILATQGVGCRIYSYCRSSPGEHWRYWSITDDETALLLSYACRADDAGREASEVEEIVSSIRLFPSVRFH